MISQQVDARPWYMREKLYTLCELLKHLPAKRTFGCVYNWSENGVKGRNGEIERLETVNFGGARCTSLEAVARFVEKLSVAAEE